MSDSSKIIQIENGGVTSAISFFASGVSCGLKRSQKKDLALVYSDRACSFAGTFTSNLFPAAPVRLCRSRVNHSSSVRAVVINSGIANACTGEQGDRDAEETAQTVADALNIPSSQVLVSSTGRIGTFLPMDKIKTGIRMAVESLSHNGGSDAVKAIMTTDTEPKEAAFSFTASNGKKVTVGGMTKGAGMISPHMLIARPHATMLCYITTDAEIENSDLAFFLENAVANSFNCISVDNDMSTNDTCVVMANGASNVKISKNGPDAELFAEAINSVTAVLAKRMVMDGEGATKFVEINVTGAVSHEDAVLCAKSIADSMLCKTAWFGGDPNWGRVLAAAGYSGAKFLPENVSLYYDDCPVVRQGMDAGTAEETLCGIIRKSQFKVNIDLGAGDCNYTVWTSDISYEYVKINADYHT